MTCGGEIPIRPDRETLPGRESGLPSVRGTLLAAYRATAPAPGVPLRSTAPARMAGVGRSSGSDLSISEEVRRTHTS